MMDDGSSVMDDNVIHSVIPFPLSQQFRQLRLVTCQFKVSFVSVLGQFLIEFRWVSGQFQVDF